MLTIFFCGIAFALGAIAGLCVCGACALLGQSVWWAYQFVLARMTARRLRRSLADETGVDVTAIRCRFAPTSWRTPQKWDGGVSVPGDRAAGDLVADAMVRRFKARGLQVTDNRTKPA